MNAPPDTTLTEESLDSQTAEKTPTEPAYFCVDRRLITQVASYPTGCGYSETLWVKCWDPLNPPRHILVARRRDSYPSVDSGPVGSNAVLNVSIGVGRRESDNILSNSISLTMVARRRQRTSDSLRSIVVKSFVFFRCPMMMVQPARGSTGLYDIREAAGPISM